MLQTLALVLAVVVAALLVLAALKPARFRVERSTRVNAPPEKVYPLIADFHQWTAWSPWEKLDPELKRTYTGAERGAGAAYAWEGNAKAGAGRMEITDAPAPSRVTINLDFTRPFEAHNVSEFTLHGTGAGTDLTWAMHGPHPYPMRLLTLFFSMDKMVGKDFEAGLAQLKALAEGEPSGRSRGAPLA